MASKTKFTIFDTFLNENLRYSYIFGLLLLRGIIWCYFYHHILIGSFNTVTFRYREMSEFDSDENSDTFAPAAGKEAKRAYLTQQLKLVKRKRAKFLNEDQKFEIIHGHFATELQNIENHDKNPNRRLKGAYAREKVAKLLGYGNKTVGTVMREWIDHQTVSEAQPPGNGNAKVSRVPQAKIIVNSVRTFVRQRRLKLQRTVAKDVLRFLIDNHYVNVSENDKKDYAAALRATQRFLVHSGYRRGKRNGAFNIQEKESLINKRNSYITEIMDNRNKPPDEQLREVYVDESYIHHHYKRFDESLYDPNDEQDLNVRQLHKGQRYCFAAAIQGSNPKVRVTYSMYANNSNDAAGMVPNTLWVFEGKNNVKDYHSTFNSVSFLNWFEQSLLANLKQPSLIIMDNASYHKTPRAEAPKFRKMKMNELRAYLTERNVQFDNNAHRPQLQSLCLTLFTNELKPATVLAAEALGHKVLFTPPYYSDLQPVELVWAHVKGYVGRKYYCGIKFLQVLAKLYEAFDLSVLSSGVIESYIEKSYVHALSFTKDGDVDDDEVVDTIENTQENNQNESDDDSSDSNSDISDYISCNSGYDTD